MKLPVGTKVRCNMQDETDSDLFKLLNTLEGEIVGHREKDSTIKFSYQVAFPVEHIDAIQVASQSHFDTKVKINLPIVGLNKSLNNPKDKRYYTLAFVSEVKPA